MATPAQAVGPDTPVAIKVTIQNTNRRLKLKFSDLSPAVLPGKLRTELGIPSNLPAVIERWSDSAACHVVLDPAEPSTYKTLFRAAKSKLKLRLRVTLPTLPQKPIVPEQDDIIPFPLLTTPALLASALPSVPTIKPQAALPQKTETMNWRSEGVSLTAKPQHAPAPSPPTLKQTLLGQIAEAGSSQRTLVTPQFPAHRFSPVGKPDIAKPTIIAPSWSVYCNACDRPMEDEHFHCDTCDSGDYDLCRRCVDAGIHCQGASHWLIKRSVKNGQVVNSSTETVHSKNHSYPDLPGAFANDKKAEVHPTHAEDEEEEATRTCNSCIVALPDHEFITCLDCDDYDLCVDCFEENQHGHHPGHTFEPVSEDKALSTMVRYLCKPGRNARHSALCDGCDKAILGVRYKCLNCPDWDYCSECFKNVNFIHKGHRFTPIYDPIAEAGVPPARHFGIYCDGHLCKGNKDYISGVRYKCAICHDTDFCGNCEASPGNTHNQTHPLIMFKSPVRNVSITTTAEGNQGEVLNTMGDRRQAFPRSVSIQNAASGVQTIADLKPSEAAAPPPLVIRPKPKIEIKDLLAEPIEEKIQVDDLLIPTAQVQRKAPADKAVELAAYYQRDTVRDGSIMHVGQQFTQVWTLVNPGPLAWPAGCSVRYVGGDNMLNVDNRNPSASNLVDRAMESNIINRSVNVGEQVEFSVTMKAPEREGTAISYWRIKAPDGLPFGHRLWCHIQVIAAPPVPAKQAHVLTQATANGEVPNRALQDYQMQLMLLEQQNKQRLLAKRVQEQQLQAKRAQEQLQSQLQQQMAKAYVQQQAAQSEQIRLQQQRHMENLHKLTAEMRSMQPFGNYPPAPVQPVQHAQATRAELASVEAQLVEIHARAKAHADALQHARNEVQHIAPSYMARARVASAAKEAADVAAASRAASVVSELSASTSTVAPSASSTKPQPASVADAPEADTEGSQMIFPTLEKESPVASIHEPEAKVVEAPEVSSPAPTSSTLEFFEDAETVDVVESSDDEMFLTDDEYDILDASDEEHL